MNLLKQSENKELFYRVLTEENITYKKLIINIINR